MEFIQGINFHSASGYKYLVSNDHAPSDFDVDRHIFELVAAQKNAASLSYGQQFYFIYPITTPKGNKQVFGRGEIVYSPMKGRENVLVSFVQYFARDLSQAAKNTLELQDFFKQYGINSKEALLKHQKGEICLKPLFTQTNPGSSKLSTYSDIFEYFRSSGSKTKRYVTTLEEGLAILNGLMHASTALRWDYSAILTPLDADYPENIIIIYGQTAKKGPPPLQASASLISTLHQVDQEILLQQFVTNISLAYPEISAATSNLLDSLPLNVLEQELHHFIAGYPKINADFETIHTLYQKTKSLMAQTAADPAPAIEDLVAINTNLNQIQRVLEGYKLKLDPSQISYFSNTDFYACLSSYSADDLLGLLDNNDESAIEVKQFRTALTAKINELNQIATDFWRYRIMGQPIFSLSISESVRKTGANTFISTGIESTSKAVNAATSAAEATNYFKAFANAVNVAANSADLTQTTRRQLIKKSIFGLPTILSSLQTKLEALTCLDTSFFSVEQALFLEVKCFLAFLFECTDKSPNQSFSEAFGAFRRFIDSVENKRLSALEEKQRLEREDFLQQRTLLDSQYQELTKTIEGTDAQYYLSPQPIDNLLERILLKRKLS